MPVCLELRSPETTIKAAVDPLKKLPPPNEFQAAKKYAVPTAPEMVGTVLS